MTLSIRTAPRNSFRARRDANLGPLDKARGGEIIWDQVAPIFEVASDIRDMKYVYFIGEGDGGPVKIGTAKDPILRLRQMQTGNSRKLKIEHALIGDSDVERLFHEIWRDHRLTGEWFRPEIREALYPVLDSARLRQCAYIWKADEERARTDEGVAIRIEDLCECVKDAHGDHDVVMRIAHRPRFLAAGGGYVTYGGRSRIEERPA